MKFPIAACLHYLSDLSDLLTFLHFLWCCLILNVCTSNVLKFDSQYTVYDEDSVVDNICINNSSCGEYTYILDIYQSPTWKSHPANFIRVSRAVGLRRDCSDTVFIFVKLIYWWNLVKTVTAVLAHAENSSSSPEKRLLNQKPNAALTLLNAV